MQESLKAILTNPLLIKAVTAILGLIIINFVFKIIKNKFAVRITKSEIRYQAEKLITFAGYIFSILFLMTIFYERLGGLTIAFGVIGAGVAFALQEVITSMAGWLAITFGKFYNAGNRVEMAGIRGDVVDISILRTTLMEVGEWMNSDQYTGRIVRIANSAIFKQPVYTYTKDFPYLWDLITIPVKFGSDYKLAKDVFQKVACSVAKDYLDSAKESWENIKEGYVVLHEARIEPWVSLMANDNWVEFSIRYVVPYEKRVSIKDKIFNKILEEVEKSEGKIELASQTVSLVELPEINLKQ